MRNFAVVFLVTVAVTGAVANANNVERDDPVTPPWEIESDGQMKLDDPLTPPPPTEDDEPLSEAADSDWISWAGDHSNLYEGDMMLTEEQVRQLNDSSAERNAVKNTNQLWPNGVIYYQFDSSTFSSTDKSRISQAFAKYAAKTCLSFVQRTNQRDYVSIIRDGGCYSYVGRIGGRQALSLGYGCVYEYIIIHEFMHASGFHHEQSRYDRDSYVRINYANIKDGKSGNFRKYTSSQVQHLGEKYDYTSVMHYSATAFSKNGQKTIERLDGSTAALGNRVGLSQVDINKLNKLYSCSGGCKDQYSNCAYWARYYCTGRYGNWMTKYCTKSCNKCASSCTDKYSNCPYWARYYCTGRYATFMTRYCAKSCNKC